MSKFSNNEEKTEFQQQLDRIERLTLLAAKDAFNMEDAAAYTGMSKDYLYRLVSEKRIPYYKSAGGRLTYFRKSELTDWLLNTRVKTDDELLQEAAAYAINNPVQGKRKGGEQ